MPKDFFQDMVKVKREAAQSGRRAREISERPQVLPPSAPLVEKTKFSSGHDSAENLPSPRKSTRALWIIAGVSIAFLFFALSFLFAGAKVTINPRIKDATLKDNFFATKNALTGDLPFDLIAIPGEESKMLQGGEEQEVSKRAEGTVVIYNTFGAGSQGLDIDTRLSGSNGKIYKTKTKVTVPGMKNGKPGSVEVGIYASEAGSEYNSEPLDFNIVGFKGTPKYSKFYARSKGDISGGLSGKMRVVSDQDKETALAELKSNLKTKLLQKATDTIPPGFVLFKDAVFLSIDDETTGIASSDGMVPLNVTGTLYGFLFEEKKLTKKIVEGLMDDYDGSDVYISNLRDLVFALSNQDSISFKDISSINFGLSGNLKVIWKLDEEKIITDMLGKKKRDFNQILSAYPNVVSAEVAFNPFWKQSFPEKKNRIKLMINYPE